ncbi:MAG: SDR family NAD(P)-dependent oxidoreductase, partial [Cyclobacteriaceae bacterium]|nr:SDR family NAD(P)-dependent oxidoreductase [Cyclobacteriaceae bacterium HetDA_MAG_MS6]
MKNIALITGASSGIGLELAKIHAARKGDLVLVARSTSKLEALKVELAEKHGVDVLLLPKDLSIPGSAEEIYQEVKARDIEVEYLVNNAGFGDYGFFHETDWDKEEMMINLNMLTLTHLTKLF